MFLPILVHVFSLLYHYNALIFFYLNQTVDAIYQQATRLQTESVNALATIQRQQVQQYIDTNLNPTLQLCRNYTTQGTNLISTASVTLNDATRSHSTAQNVSTQTSLVSALMSNLPSIDANLLLQVKDNIVRIRGAYTALNLTSALAVLRAGYQEQAIKIADYRSRITLLKAQINGYKLMYDSVVNLNCRIPSQVP